MEIQKFKLYVNCMTYNHSAYIEDTLNGFCMQETNFPFVCVVMDDASTDGEQQVIEKYLHEHFDLSDDTVVRNEETDDFKMTFACHKKNRNCFFAVYYLKFNHWKANKSKDPYYAEWADNVKYIAFCEGDDYWIDSNKLQKQVNVLDTHSNVTCVHTGFNTIDKDGNNIIRPFYEKCMKISHTGDVLRTVINGNYVMLLTTLFRREVFISDIYLDSPIVFYDYTMTFAAAMLGDFFYLPEKTACYRRTPGSAMERMHSDPSDPLIIAQNNVYSYFAKLIVSKNNLSIKDKIPVRLHILVHLLKIKDDDNVNRILKTDWMSRVMYPFVLLYVFCGKRLVTRCSL